MCPFLEDCPFLFIRGSTSIVSILTASMCNVRKLKKKTDEESYDLTLLEEALTFNQPRIVLKILESYERSKSQCNNSKIASYNGIFKCGHFWDLERVS